MEKVNARTKKVNTSLYKCPTINCDDCKREIPKSSSFISNTFLVCCKCAVRRITFAK